MDLSVTFLGTAASAPSSARGTAAALVARGGERILVDCGEGTQRQLLRSGIGLVDLDLILLTHLHGDHILGLPGLLKTYALRGRDRELPLVGPVGTATLLDRLGPLIGRLPYPLEVDEWRPGAELPRAGWRIASYPTEHRIASLGYVLGEDDRPGAFDVAAATALGVPPGRDFGVLQRGGTVVAASGRAVRSDEVLGPPRAGRRIVLTGDTVACGATIDAARGADLLVHEATFLESDAERAAETTHATARGAALVATAAEVALLALTHLSSRVLPRDVEAEARGIFPRAVVVRDFDRVEIPFPERGAPVHVPRPRWDAARLPEGSEEPHEAHL